METNAMTTPRTLIWFSCGVTSAVAAKIELEHTPNAEVLYCDTGGEHEDNLRFIVDCGKWFQRDIIVLKNPNYVDHFDVFEKRKFLVGPRGAPCTRILKRELREKYQRPDDLHIFGFDSSEASRVEDFRENNPGLSFRAPLIEMSLNKPNCKAIVERAGIELPMMYKLGYSNNNCFTGETEFITDLGTKRLVDCVGQSVRVRGSGGGWTEATIQSFGRQPIVELVVSRGGTHRTIRTTAGHRWFVKQSSHQAKLERTTVQLQQGDRLRSVFGRLAPRVRPSSFGVAQGIVFGDGTRGTTLNTAATLVLCGDKNKTLLDFFPLQPRAVIATGIEVRDLPRFWKDPPRIDDCQSFLYGWLSGYFAADGCATTSGEYFISSANKSHLEVARDVAVRIGIGSNGIRETIRSGFGGPPTPIYTLSLIGRTLREDFFLIEEHKRRFVESTTREPHPWIVQSVTTTTEVDDVYCAVVPEGNAFTLDGNILTGNCIACVKGGMGYWNRIRIDFPEHFQRMSDIETKIGHTILRDQKTGERIPLSMLPPDAGRFAAEQPPNCDVLCEIALANVDLR